MLAFFAASFTKIPMLTIRSAVDTKRSYTCTTRRASAQRDKVCAFIADG